MWHRAFLPPFDALCARVQAKTGLDALLLLPLYLAFQALLSRPFPRWRDLRDRARNYRTPGAPTLRLADLAHPLPVFAAAFVFSLLSYLRRLSS